MRASKGDVGFTIVQGKVYYVKQNADLTWPDSAEGADSATRPGDGTTFTISKAYDHYKASGYSTTYSKDESGRTAAHPGDTVSVGEDADALYVYYSIDTCNLRFYSDLEGKTVWKTETVGYGSSLESYAPTAPTADGKGAAAATWEGAYQLSNLNSEMYTFGGWATEPGINTWMDKDGNTPGKAFDWTQKVTGDIDLYPIWVQNYVSVRLDLGAWDRVAVDNADGRSDWYDKDKYDPNTPASMPGDENVSSGGSYQKRSFNKSTVITAATSDHDKYLDMERMNGATRAGYTLDGWYTASGVKWVPTYLISREYGDKDGSGNLELDYYKDYRNFGYPLTLTARWNLNNAAVTYDDGDGSGAPTDDGIYKVGDTIGVKSAPTAPSNTDLVRYEFKGWRDPRGVLHKPGETVVYTDETLVSAYGATNTITFIAEYLRIPQGSLVFDSQGGSIIAPVEGDATAVVDLTDDKFKPTRVGYTFGGWYKDAACTDGQSVGNSIAIGEGGQRIYAKWTANQYTMTFDSKGGTPVGSITQDYNTEVTPPANPTRTGYTFQGWDIAVPAKMPARNMTLYALWKVNQHEVTYKYNDNTTADKVENLNYGEPVVELAAPEWEGHVFCGWKYEPGGEVSFPFAMPDANVTLKAVWKESQTAPNPPDIDIDTVEPTSITLKGTKNGEEYILVPKGTAPTDENWKNAKKLGDGVTQIAFGGLVPNTEYDVYARKFETEGTDSTLGKAPSPASQPTSATTPKQNQAAPAAPTVRPAGSTSMVVDPTQDGVEYAIVPKGQEQLLSDAVWKSPSEAGGTVVFGGLEPETEYVAYARMKETDRQNPSEPSQRSDSAKTLKLPEITAPTVMEGLVYAGEGHELLNAGSTEQGTMLYRLGDGEWSEDVPAGLDAGAYDVWYMVRGDTGNGYGDTEPVELAAAIAKAPSTVTAPTGKALTYNGTAQTLADAGSAEGGELLYAVATENVAPEESAYTAELPAATDVGSYFVWYMVKGDANHEDIAPDKVESSIAEVDKAELEEAIGEAGAVYEGIKDDHPDVAKALKDAIDDAKAIADNKNVTAEQVVGALAALQEARAKAGADVVTYFCLSGSVASWTKGSPDLLTFTFKRTVKDEKTFESFKGAKVDGADVPELAYTAAEGSLVLSLMAAYLETLSPGDHELAVAFEDGEATATFTVKAAETNDAEKAAKADDAEKSAKADGAAAKGGSASGSSKAASAKTGDSVPVALVAICVALAAAALIAAVLAIRKRRAGK